MAKLANEIFINRVKEKNKLFANGDIELRGDYIGAHSTIPAYCNIHSRSWDAYPNKLYEGRGCPSCGYEQKIEKRIIKQDEFINRLQQCNQFFVQGDFVLLGEYNGRHNTIPAYCNIHNCNWNAEPAKLYEGKGCPNCSMEHAGKLQSIQQEEFINRLTQCNKFFVNGDIELRGPYRGRHIAIPGHCNIHNFDWDAWPASLYEGRGCPHCSWSTLGEHSVLSHEEFVARVYEINPELTVVGKYINGSVPVDIQCKEGHIWSPLPQKILHDHQGCPYCSGHRVWVGFNDIWTTRPDIAKLLKNPDDGYKYTYGSGKRLDFICPDCGSISNKKLNTVSCYGFSCPYCGDGISYPEKFGRAFLDQLKISNHICEYQPEWGRPYFYDDYFIYANQEYIIEWDGAFHYLKRSKTKLSLEERQAIDKLKDDIAIQHNINIIRIDCLLSTLDYIQQHILESELSHIFDLSNINWNLCDEKAQSNLVKEACNLYNSGIHSTSQIGVKLHISAGTICIYLKNGSKFGWCNYNPKRSKKVTQQND